MLNEGNQIHSFILCTVSTSVNQFYYGVGTVIRYGSGCAKVCY